MRAIFGRYFSWTQKNTRSVMLYLILCSSNFAQLPQVKHAKQTKYFPVDVFWSFNKNSKSIRHRVDP